MGTSVQSREFPQSPEHMGRGGTATWESPCTRGDELVVVIGEGTDRLFVSHGGRVEVEAEVTYVTCATGRGPGIGHDEPTRFEDMRGRRNGSKRKKIGLVGLVRRDWRDFE